MSKKSVLVVSGICGGVFLLLLTSLLYDLCGSYRPVCKEVYGFIVYVFFPLPVIFLLSLITLKMREEVFQAWWGFARWFAPVIMLVTFLQNSQVGGSGLAGVIGGGFDMFVLGILYVILVGVSIVKIVRARRKTIS